MVLCRFGKIRVLRGRYYVHLLSALLIGACLGAAFCSYRCIAMSTEHRLALSELLRARASVAAGLFSVAWFPILLAAVGCLHSPGLLYFCFALRGFSVAYCSSALLLSGAERSASAFLVAACVPVLPVCFWESVCFLRRQGEGLCAAERNRLLFLLAASIALGLLVRIILYHRMLL